MKHICAAGALAAVLLGTAACGDPEEILGDAVSAASCTAAQQAVAPIKDGARSAVEKFGVDPAGARRELQALKAAVDATAATARGELRQSLEGVSGDLGVLLDEAKATARGTVDQQEVDRAQDELASSVDEVTRIC